MLTLFGSPHRLPLKPRKKMRALFLSAFFATLSLALSTSGSAKSGAKGNSTPPPPQKHAEKTSLSLPKAPSLRLVPSPRCGVLWPCQSTQKAKPTKYSLPVLLQLASQRNPMIEAANARLEAMKAQKQEAVWGSWWPQMQLIGLIAPAPPARGNAISSDTPIPDAYLWFDQYGIMTRLEFSLIWPVYTFGKLSLYQKAASAGVEVGHANVSLEQSKLALMVRKAYHGLLFAEGALSLLDEVEEYIEQAKKRVKGKTDRLKVEVFGAELSAQRLKAEAGRSMAQAGLARLTGLPTEPPIKLDADELEEPEIKMLSLDAYQRWSQRFRPEIQLLQHAMDAKRSLLQVQQRAWAPDIFIMGFFRGAYTSSATDQFSPFARDDFNFADGGLLLGVRFNLDIPVQIARTRKAEAEFNEFQSQERFAKMGIALQVEQHYREAVAAQKAVKIFRRSRKAANQWMTRSMMSFSSGLIETRDVTEALTAAAKNRFSYLEALHQFHTALSELSRAVGIDVTQLKDEKPSSSPIHKPVALRPSQR